MKLLFCCRTPLTKEMGTPKGLLELSEHLRLLGWQCDVRGLNDILAFAKESGSLKSPRGRPRGLKRLIHTSAKARIIEDDYFSKALRFYLLHHAADYDVVEYDHAYLPYKRAEFASRTLLVARSFLLVQHMEKFPVPQPGDWKTRLKRWLNRASSDMLRHSLHNAKKTVDEADLINVNNYDAKTELVSRGIADDKIVVFGRAIGQQRRDLFNAISADVPVTPIVAFVGSFDYRKGAADFPTLLKSIADRVPDVRFRLLGTAGLFPTEAQVRNFFSADLNARMQVLPRFKAEELPELLSDCSVGVFPSYLEGFGIGVLEMLAAAMPVIAYNAPGPPMMLPDEYLVPIGDSRAMSEKVVDLLSDADKLSAARNWARARSQEFTWAEIAQGTSEAYQQNVERLRSRG